MRWLDYLFHEPKDQEVVEIKRSLDAEKDRHGRELSKISDALVELGQAYDLADQERWKA